MKVAHKNEDGQELPFSKCLETGKELEASNELAEAVKLYQKCIKLNPVSEFSYNRLMILYRKQKEYQKELAVINSGIKAFENLYNKPERSAGSGIIRRLSKALLKSTGLADKKGKILFEHQPILRWRKRALMVNRLIKR